MSRNIHESIHQYIKEIEKDFKSLNATEHTYRATFQRLFEALVISFGDADKFRLTNEPKRQQCGAPDFILTKQLKTKSLAIPVGYIETKDIGITLDKVENPKTKKKKEPTVNLFVGTDDEIKQAERNDQFARYVKELDNLILTDYLEFRFFLKGKKRYTVAIATIDKANNSIQSSPENFERFVLLMQDFIFYQSETIKTAPELVTIIAGKARYMRDIFLKALKKLTGTDEEKEEKSHLFGQLQGFRSVLVKDMDETQFANIYAQTLAYGLFTARLHDTTTDDFSRTEAHKLIPKSNPFLRKLFDSISSLDLDQEIDWIIDDLCEVFRASNITAIFRDFGKATGQNDPVLHFYETFLDKYDPQLRKERGVYYTPEAVVSFIVRATDELLKTRFELKNGLASNDKITINDKTVHKVQVLDPASGTGTFLAHIIQFIYHKYKGQEGLWTGIVENDLIPRLHGFELMMAPYAICHLNLDLLLRETGYQPLNPDTPRRFSVYLANSLEEYHQHQVKIPFARWLSDEAQEADRIKRDTPIMVVIGNPPYLGESKNKGTWIMQLMKDYKKEPNSNQKLKERNPKWINNDYVKFIRLAHHYIEKNGEGIIAFITSNSYLDSPTFRGVRWRLLNSFDEIFILDLHGNSDKGETTLEGLLDKNVFNIAEGVAIILAVKNPKTNNDQEKILATVYNYDLYGDRKHKFDFLYQNTLTTVPFTNVDPVAPFYFFKSICKDYTEEYYACFSVNELFELNSVGLVTARDHLCIHDTAEKVLETVTRFTRISVEDARGEFDLGDDVRDWTVGLAQKDLINHQLNVKLITPIAYRPFDTRYTFYTGKTKGFICMPRKKVMSHMLAGDNVGLVVCRQIKSGNNFHHCFITDKILESCLVSNKTGEIGYVFPLYRYESRIGEQGLNKVSNLKKETVEGLALAIGSSFDDLTPETVLDYVYGILHHRSYRERYAECLKFNFPRIPFPNDADTFECIRALGQKLRLWHLLEHSDTDEFITRYPITGDHAVTLIHYQNEKVWINDKQYFDNVPPEAWTFYIGGYQPAQKWLKDREGRNLSTDDLYHYQRIIKALYQSVQIMDELEQIALF